MSTDILIIGHGVVGFNVENRLFGLNPEIWDKYKGLDTRTKKKYDFAYICVDTPITEKCLCDISEVRAAICENNADIYIIRSTVLPGVTEKLAEETGKTIIFSSEYYGGTQHCNNYNFDSSRRRKKSLSRGRSDAPACLRCKTSFQNN